MRDFALYEAGRRARLSGAPFNPKNTPDWQAGWRDAGDDQWDDDDWMLDPDMGARG